MQARWSRLGAARLQAAVRLGAGSESRGRRIGSELSGGAKGVQRSFAAGVARSKGNRGVALVLVEKGGIIFVCSVFDCASCHRVDIVTESEPLRERKAFPSAEADALYRRLATRALSLINNALFVKGN